MDMPSGILDLPSLNSYLMSYCKLLLNVPLRVFNNALLNWIEGPCKTNTRPWDLLMWIHVSGFFIIPWKHIVGDTMKQFLWWCLEAWCTQQQHTFNECTVRDNRRKHGHVSCLHSILGHKWGQLCELSLSMIHYTPGQPLLIIGNECSHSHFHFLCVVISTDDQVITRRWEMGPAWCSV